MDTSVFEQIQFNPTPPTDMLLQPGEPSAIWSPAFANFESSSEFLQVTRVVKLEATDDSIITKITDIEYVGGNWFILDGDRGFVYRFSDGGTFLGQVGGKGSGPGEYQRPSTLTRWDQYLAVIDSMTRRVLLYDSEGRFIEARSPGKMSISLNFDIIYHDQRLYVASFVARNETTPYHLIFDVSKPDWQVLWGFGHRFPLPYHKKDVHEVVFTSFAMVGNRIWTGSPYSSEVEVYDLDGRLLGTLQPGLDGITEDELARATNGNDFIRIISSKPGNEKIVYLPPFALIFYRQGKMTLYSAEGMLVKANLRVHDFHIRPFAINDWLVAPVDLGFYSTKYIEKITTPEDYAKILASGFSPEDRENDNPYLVISTYRDVYAKE